MGDDRRRFRFGPSRTYVGRFGGRDEVLEVVYSNGDVERLAPNDRGPHAPSFKWDYSGSGSLQTAAAILTHALGEPLDEDTGRYSKRVEVLVRDFLTAFIGDAHHGNVRNGFEIPGEIVVLWVLKSERRIVADAQETFERRRFRGHTTREIADRIMARPSWTVLHGEPRTLPEILRIPEE